ncbi:MAG: signal peptidase I [Acidimicrobiaceae bacterium]|nr:signal peptidase I [Acidimicrobiaceae bacterium]
MQLGANTSSSGAVILLIPLAVFVLYVVAGWKIFAKAGEPGWGIFIPIYNLYLVCKISGRPEWWLILFFIPLVNIVIGLIVAMDIAKSFAKSSGFGIGLWLLNFIFVPILGFGPAQYTPPAALSHA